MKSVTLAYKRGTAAKTHRFSYLKGSDHIMQKRYLQLYSIFAQLREDFDGSLQKVKDMGYTGVEFAGTFYNDYTAAELKAKLDALDLDVVGWHIRTEQVPEVLDYMAELGVRYLIDPMRAFSTQAEALAFTEELNTVGKLCAEKGIRFGYHNHRHEFLTGEDGYLMETLLLNTDPRYVTFQLDVGWAVCSGVDATAFLTKYADRFQLIHVKECAKVGGAVPPMDFSAFPKDENGRPVIPDELRAKMRAEREWDVATGTGLIDWAAVRDAATYAEAFIIEREWSYKEDVFACIQEDCDYLKQL